MTVSTDPTVRDCAYTDDVEYRRTTGATRTIAKLRPAKSIIEALLMKIPLQRSIVA
jgi:hypothetical protein